MRSNPVDVLRSRIEGLLPFVVPVLVYPFAGPGVESWITGGSALLATTEQNRFLVTADHLVREIDNLSAQGEIVVLLGGTNSTPIDISHWSILARDDFIDICTMQVPPEFEANELEKGFFPLNRWPPTLAKKGDQAIIMGFPAEHRRGYEKTINARVLPISDVVTDVGPRRFTIADENNQREILINPDNLPFPMHLGGMSGSPVFRIADNTRPEFLGVFLEGSDGLRGAYFCSHAQFLLPNGHLNARRIPPR